MEARGTLPSCLEHLANVGPWTVSIKKLAQPVRGIVRI